MKNHFIIYKCIERTSLEVLAFVNNRYFIEQTSNLSLTIKIFMNLFL